MCQGSRNIYFYFFIWVGPAHKFFIEVRQSVAPCIILLTYQETMKQKVSLHCCAISLRSRQLLKEKNMMPVGAAFRGLSETKANDAKLNKIALERNAQPRVQLDCR